MAKTIRPRAGMLPAPLPQFVHPMKPTLAAKPPARGQWLHEVKFDGYRAQARIESGRAVIMSSSGAEWTRKFGKHLAAALAALPVDTALIDGEVVVEDPATGVSDFAALQEALAGGRTSATRFWAFDLLYRDGLDLRGQPLVERRRQLLAIMGDASPCLAYSETLPATGDELLALACRMNLEGVVSKRADSTYRSGPTQAWIKSKCVQRESFIVGGWLPAVGPLDTVGSLLLGQMEHGALRYVGRVGTGIDGRAAADLAERLRSLRAGRSPFRAGEMSAGTRKAARFARPELVAEVEIRGWTGDGKVRHASFKALRRDKAPASVRRG